MTQEHPITPPSELAYQWRDETCSQDTIGAFDDVAFATRAARWGADMELEACCELLKQKGVPAWSLLRLHRRPKPPSLKQQALDGLRTIECNIPQSQRAFEDSCEHIRRALESLPD